MKPLKDFWHKAWWSKTVIIAIGLFLWPLLIAFFLSFPISRIKDSKIKWSSVGFVWLIAAFFTVAWVQALTSPHPRKTTPTQTVIPSPTPLITPTSTFSPTPTPAPGPKILGRQSVRATVAIDGDTIEIEGGFRIRYIGINTPETVDPRKPVECFGREASDKNQELVGGKMVELEKDVSETDKYGRLLRYVFVGGIFVNDYLVRQGYAYATSYPPDVKYQDQFRQAEQEAREESRGLWGACSATSTYAPIIQITPAPGQNQNCDSSYPDVCIAPPPPDLDCSDIPYRRFRVLSPDPHRFDGDHDGVGCEM